MKQRQRLPPIPTSPMPLVDTHCHLDMEAYHQDLEEILQKALQNNIRAVLSVGIDEASSIRAVEIARRHPMVYATVGVHPHDVDNLTDRTYTILANLVQENKDRVVGYGEIGLDYAKRYSAPENQRKHFRNQLALADALHLPVVIHDREAHEDTLVLLKEGGPLRWGGIMHCFSGDMEFAQKILDLGLHISIPGTVTFKNAASLQEVAKTLPLSSLLLETDGPFLAPHPYRGKRNEPLFLLHTAQAVAELRGISLSELARQTTQNAIDLFQLNIPHP